LIDRHAGASKARRASWATPRAPAVGRSVLGPGGLVEHGRRRSPGPTLLRRSLSLAVGRLDRAELGFELLHVAGVAPWRRRIASIEVSGATPSEPSPRFSTTT
jgi:hypothetical protein